MLEVKPLNGMLFNLAACEELVHEIQCNEEWEDTDSSEIKPPVKFKGMQTGGPGKWRPSTSSVAR